MADNWEVVLEPTSPPFNKEENKGLAKEEKMKMSPFYVEGDMKVGSFLECALFPLLINYFR